MTPLELKIADLVRAGGGAMSIGHYMVHCLADPERGYYMTRDPLGVAGDFTTAPEISQMFGEVVGLWAADMWAKLDAPSPFALVELGPGRGTLMADMLRAGRVMPAFTAAARIHLVETSPVLRELQARTLAGAAPGARWHGELATVPPGPVIVIANEFLDALPVFQFERVAGAWRERLVMLDDNGSLAIGHGDPLPNPDRERWPDAPDGAISERAPARERIVRELALRITRHNGAALIIDYGHVEGGFGDTLQAVRAHRPVGILDHPGESDLTSHVDFAALARAAAAAGARCHGPIEMGTFLLALGIAERARRLGAGKDRAVRKDVDAALRRLTGPAAMGSLFQVLALASPDGPVPEPFAQMQSPR
jgi:SAM-dependent MidA family methyltransferase